MARRRAKGPDQEQADLADVEQGRILMLPPARQHKHEHSEDPYKVLPAAVPGRAKATSLGSEPIKRDLTPEDKARREIARAEQKELGRRYDAFLDAMILHGGDKRLALIDVYGEEEVNGRGIDELHLEVRRGIGSTEVGATLERFDLDATARARMLAKHVYSDNPAASLKAIDMVNEMAGDGGGGGSFEGYLRITKERERLQQLHGAGAKK